MRKSLALLLLLPLVLLVTTLTLYGQAPAKVDTCIECHAAMDGNIQKPALLYKDDIHAANGIGCADCHGGDRTNSDMGDAMSKAKGFIGKPSRESIPKLCSTCHSNPEYIRKYKPQQRVDQFELYQTSIHGKRLAGGDKNVATCIDCHSVHDIRAVKNTQSPVYPTRLPDTCGHCHADKTKMASYGIPTNQLEDYKTSVHWNAMTKRGDLSAPNCASCHGNHGAKPPTVESVAAVCANCHVLFGQLYAKSVHEPIFSGAPGGGGCVVCHSNHAIHQPSNAMHQFNVDEVRKPIDAGMAVAKETLGAGQQALKERNTRRVGLAISGFLIALTVAGIWFTLRRMEAGGEEV